MTVAGQTLPVVCTGQSFVGFGVSNTFVGTVQFEGSNDGLTWFPLSLTPFASGTAVSSTTATGNWFAPVTNLAQVRARLSAYTSGSVTVIIATSIDQSYQDAFLASTTLFPTHTATGAVNTLTQAAQANRAWVLKSLKLDASSTPSFLTLPHVQIKDGTGTVLWQFNLPTVGSSGQLWDITLPTGGIVNTPGNSFVIVLANPQGSVVTNINAQFEAA
jgi:hypothetical protein